MKKIFSLLTLITLTLVGCNKSETVSVHKEMEKEMERVKEMSKNFHKENTRNEIIGGTFSVELGDKMLVDKGVSPYTDKRKKWEVTILDFEVVKELEINEDKENPFYKSEDLNKEQDYVFLTIQLSNTGEEDIHSFEFDYTHFSYYDRNKVRIPTNGIFSPAFILPDNPFVFNPIRPEGVITGVLLFPIPERSFVSEIIYSPDNGRTEFVTAIQNQ